ncbi:MAG: IS110 family transposase [Actinobacteria bacterium]|nr:IS110 family transposase [Actinomycetota bacterium]
MAAEIGAISNFEPANGLQCYAGKASVTRRSGKSDLVVADRLACNGYRRDAVQRWAFCSLRYLRWAREFYDAHRAEAEATTPPCAPSATDGSKSSGSASAVPSLRVAPPCRLRNP